MPSTQHARFQEWGYQGKSSRYVVTCDVVKGNCRALTYVPRATCNAVICIWDDKYLSICLLRSQISRHVNDGTNYYLSRIVWG